MKKKNKWLHIQISIGYGFKLLTGLLLSKLISVYAGPTGLTILGQFKNFFAILTTISTGGSNSGIVKNLAVSKNDTFKISEVQSTSVFLTVLITLPLGTMIFFISNYISRVLLNDASYSYSFKVFAIAFVFIGLNQLLLFFVNGLGKVDLYSRIIVYQSLINLVLTFVFVVNFHLTGALLVLSIGQIVIFIFTFIYTRDKSVFNLKYLRPKVSTWVFVQLKKYSLMGIINSGVTVFSILIIRSLLIDRYGITETGKWQAIWQFSDVYLGLATLFLQTLFYPRISECLNNPTELKRLVYKTLKSIFLFVILISTFIFIFKGEIILILFSSEFLSSLGLLNYQLAGNLFKIMSWIFSFYFLARAYSKIVIVTNLVVNGTFILLTYYFTSSGLIVNVTIAYFYTYLLYFIVSYYIFHITVERVYNEK